MNTNPLVSVIMPVYNVASYLRECLDSVCNQTLKNIEIICVDDGSTDGSLDILQEYAVKDDRVKVIRQQNQYAGVARQNGMSVAQGKYLAFVDSDDFFEPQMLENMAKAAETYGTDVVVCGSDCYKEDLGEYMPAPWNLRLEYVEGANLNNFCPAELIPEKIFHFVNPAPWSKLFRASFVRENNLSWAPLQHTNDILFVCSALAKAKSWSVVNEVYVHYRMRSNSISHSKKKDIRLHYAAFEGLKAKLKELGVNNRIMHSFNERLLTGVVWNLGTLQIEKARELRELIINHYEPLFQLLSEPVDCYEQKNAYLRYKAIVRPYMTIVLRQGEVANLRELDGFMTRLLALKDYDFDVLCVSYNPGSTEAKIFAKYAQQELRCEHVSVASKEAMDEAMSQCRGGYIVRMKNAQFFQYQMKPVLTQLEKMWFLTPGEYDFEQLELLAAVLPEELEKDNQTLPLMYHLERATEVKKIQNQQVVWQKEIANLKKTNAQMVRSMQLVLCMPSLMRRYRLLQFWSLFSFGKRKQQLLEKKKQIKLLIRECRQIKADGFNGLLSVK